MNKPAKSAAGSAKRRKTSGRKTPRLLIFIVAYNAEKTIREVLGRIPEALTAYNTEILIIDDSSRDNTFAQAHKEALAGDLPFPLTVLFNPVNQGYGGNQKLGFHYAIEQKFDVVALVHGDGQYAPECLPELLAPLLAGEADAVFGSRMLTRGGARRGGMPLYKFIGNKVLTAYQNFMLGASLSEFHSGYRLYSVPALARIPFALNTNVFHFDTEIIIQFLFAGLRIKELPIPTYYGDEICNVDGLRYAWDVVCATFVARVQDFGILYRRNFDVRPGGSENAHYSAKLDFASPHSEALSMVTAGERVLDLGCAGGYLGPALKAKGCRTTGVDKFAIDDPEALGFERFIRHDLDDENLPVTLEDYDTVLLLDVIEHLKTPERFVEALRRAARRSPDTRVLVSTGNIGFAVARLMLMIGQFNYGKRGILDLDHKRLFTFRSLRRLFEQAGFEIVAVRGIPAPFPKALGDNRLSRALLAVNRLLIAISKGTFAYQMFLVVRPLPSLTFLLDSAGTKSAELVRKLGAKD